MIILEREPVVSVTANLMANTPAPERKHWYITIILYHCAKNITGLFTAVQK